MAESCAIFKASSVTLSVFFSASIVTLPSLALILPSSYTDYTGPTGLVQDNLLVTRPLTKAHLQSPFAT